MSNVITQPISRAQSLKKLASLSYLPVGQNPFNIGEMLKLRDFEESSLVTEIEKNISLSALVLAIANSPYFKFTRQVNTISQAVLAICSNNYDQIKVIVDGLIENSVPSISTACYFNYSSCLRHSFFTARIMRDISTDIFLTDFYAIGLLANCGTLALVNLYPKQFDSISDPAQPLPEEEMFGLSRFEASHFLLDKWGLPVKICQAVLHTANPERAGENIKLASVLNIAASLAAEILNMKKIWYINVNQKVDYRIFNFSEEKYFNEYLEKLKKRFRG